MTTFKTTGTCSRAINYEVEDGVVTKCEFVGGCPGNTQRNFLPRPVGAGARAVGKSRCLIGGLMPL